MTVIAWDGKILAADKMNQTGDTISTTTKIKQLPSGEILAISGTSSIGLMMISWYESGADKSNFPITTDKDLSSSMIVADCSGCRAYHSSAGPFPIKVEDKFAAWAVGREAALGAMEMGANAIKAVEVASKWVLGCGRGVDSFEVRSKEMKNANDNIAYICECGNANFNLLNSLCIECSGCGKQFGLWRQMGSEVLYSALDEIISRIEDCGASVELTNAVSFASDTKQAIGNIWNKPDEYAMQRVYLSIGDKNE